MAKTAIVLDVVCDPAWTAGTRVNAYSDFGCGVIDYTQPLLGRGVRAFPETAPVRNFGDGRLGEVMLGGHRAKAKRELGPPGVPLGAIGLSESVELISLAVEVPPAFAMHQFAVKAFDEAGVEQGATIEAEVFVSSTDPEPPAAFTLMGHDSGTGKLSFAVA